MDSTPLVHNPKLHPLDDELSVTHVPSRTFKGVFRGSLVNIPVQAAAVAPSMIRTLRDQRNALGVYSMGAKKGDIVAAYLGPVEDLSHAKRLFATGHGSHLQRVGPDPVDCYVVNGAYDCPDCTLPETERVRWGLLDYITRGAVGNLVNDYVDSREGAANCRGLVFEVLGVELPCAVTGETVSVQKVLFLQATRDLEYGDELLRDMGVMHRTQYILSGSYERGVVFDPWPLREGTGSDEEAQVAEAPAQPPAPRRRVARFDPMSFLAGYGCD